MEERWRWKVYGRVQGVYFRAYTQQQAQHLGLKGFVRNEPDGSVCIEAQGNPEALQKLYEWSHEGSPLAEVKKVQLLEKTTTLKPFQGFTIER